MSVAIGAFERGLLTPSRWDRFLKATGGAHRRGTGGVPRVLLRGLRPCHAGALLGGNLYQKIGVMKPYPDADPGRYKVTKVGKRPDDVQGPVAAKRGPDRPVLPQRQGRRLEQAVTRWPSTSWIRSSSPAEEIASIVAFLNSLTGEIPSNTSRSRNCPRAPRRRPNQPRGSHKSTDPRSRCFCD